MDLNGNKLSKALHTVKNAINVCDSYILLLKVDGNQPKGNAFLLDRDKMIGILTNISSRCKVILDEFNTAIDKGKDDATK